MRVLGIRAFGFTGLGDSEFRVTSFRGSGF